MSSKDKNQKGPAKNGDPVKKDQPQDPAAETKPDTPEGELPPVDPANAVQDPEKVKPPRSEPPPQEMRLDPAMYWELKAKRNAVLLAGERLNAMEREFHAARAEAGEFEKKISQDLKLKIPITAYRLEDEGTKAILNLRPMPGGMGPGGPGGPPQG